MKSGISTTIQMRYYWRELKKELCSLMHQNNKTSGCHSEGIFAYAAERQSFTFGTGCIGIPFLKKKICENMFSCCIHWVHNCMSHKRIEHGLKMFHYPAVLPAEAINSSRILKTGNPFRRNPSFCIISV